MRMDNTIANDVLERYNENGKVFVPMNFTATSAEGYTRYAERYGHISCNAICWFTPSGRR